MGVREEQERRRDLLQRAFEAYSDPEQALVMALRMEHFIIDGETSREEPQEAPQPVVPPSSEQPRKLCKRSRWTAADDDRLRQLWQKDLPVEAIAQEVQRTPASIYGRLRILDLSPGKQDRGKEKRKVDLPDSDKRPPATDTKVVNGFDDVGIEGVVHFLRTRDYTVVPTADHRYDLDGRKILTAQELFERANKVRAQLGRPTWSALENGPRIENSHGTGI
ncbi:MAG: hypothetical protein O7I42_19490 [Alphaproteobacteria bacterium]|nr:hypothetical protein [Alphaproteobacteria bacterium]